MPSDAAARHDVTAPPASPLVTPLGGLRQRGLLVFEETDNLLDLQILGLGQELPDEHDGQRGQPGEDHQDTAQADGVLRHREHLDEREVGQPVGHRGEGRGLPADRGGDTSPCWPFLGDLARPGHRRAHHHTTEPVPGRHRFRRWRSDTCLPPSSSLVRALPICDLLR
jgi:hypothetical protein